MRSVIALISVAIASEIHAQAVPPWLFSESLDSPIGYSSVEEALTALKRKPGTQVREENAWTIVVDRESVSVQALWSFTSPGHEAHPTAVKRTVTERDGRVYLDMKVLCQAKQEPCAQLVREFQARNDRLRQQYGSPRQKVGNVFDERAPR